MFYDGAEFISNVGTGYGGAILNHAELDFIADGGVPFNLNFEDNYCGEQEVRRRTLLLLKRLYVNYLKHLFHHFEHLFISLLQHRLVT